MRDQPDELIKDFISRVVPWPVNDLGTYTGYINLHWLPTDHYERKKKKQGSYMPGSFAQTPTGFMQKLWWARQQSYVGDIYFCTTLQSETSISKNGYPIAFRGKESAISAKALWLDIDVASPGLEKPHKDEAGKPEYANRSEAMAALDAFLVETNLPPPNIIVCSGEEVLPDGEMGGGIQVYWINETPLSIADWWPYANGLVEATIKHKLHCDTTCTADSARVLRLPGTYNCKKEPKRPVKILKMEGTTNILEVFTHLRSETPYHPVTAKVKRSNIIIDPKEFPQRDLPPEGVETFTNCEREPVPLDPTKVLQPGGCPFLEEAFATGGRTYAQPLWHLSVLCATFFENGRAIAHAFGDQHHTYTTAETDEMYDLKISVREEKGMGWPRCTTIHTTGYAGCLACPHFAKQQTPLHLAELFVPEAEEVFVPQQTGSLVNVNKLALGLPGGYTLNAQGFICKTDPETGDFSPLFRQRIFWMIAEKNSKAYISIQFMQDLGRMEFAVLKSGDLTNNTTLKAALYDQGLLLTTFGEAHARVFLMDWMTKYWEACKAQRPTPYGWYYTDENEVTGKTTPKGFVYNNQIFHDDGAITPAARAGDRSHEAYYRPSGTKENWLNATKLITSRRRPELDILLCLGFAAPLIRGTGQRNCVISAYGESGGGKSTAVDVALSVWGSPVITRMPVGSTAKSMSQRMNAMRNFPVMQDDIKEEPDFFKLLAALFKDGGVLYNALNKDGTQREPGEWQLMMGITINRSFAEFVEQQLRGDDSGAKRLFEYRLDPNDPPPLYIDGVHISPSECEQIHQNLTKNYGVVGEEYAKALGTNPGAALKRVGEIYDEIAAYVKFDMTERFWLSAVACTIAGAEWAIKLGVDIDMPALRQFLITTLLDNRARHKKIGSGGNSAEHLHNTLSDFFGDPFGNMLWTDEGLPIGGRSKKIDIPLWPRDPQHVKGDMRVRWCVSTRQCIISQKKLKDWVVAKNIPYHTIEDGLKREFTATVSKVTLAGGTSYRGDQEQCFIMPVPVGSWLEDRMLRHATAEAVRDAAEQREKLLENMEILQQAKTQSETSLSLTAQLKNLKPTS